MSHVILHPTQPQCSSTSPLSRRSHGIDVSIVSTANPWLDFLPPSEALKAAQELNADLQAYCSAPVAEDLPTDSASPLPTTFKPKTDNRLFGLGLLPLVPGIEAQSVVQVIKDLKVMDKMKVRR